MIYFSMFIQFFRKTHSRKLLLMCLKETHTWLCEATPCSFFPGNYRFRNIRIRVHAKPQQSCLTLRDPMDYSPPGSSVHRILQARILEWIDIPFSRGSSRPRDRTQVTPHIALPAKPPGKTHICILHFI